MEDLKFKNGKLKIMHITDTHLDDDNIDKVLSRIHKEEIEELKAYRKPKESTLQLSVTTASQIEHFIGDNEFYIYGTGEYACSTYWRYAKGKNKFRGFIVSDGQNQLLKELFGHPIKSYSDVMSAETSKIILGVNAKNAEVIMEQFKDTSKILRIF